MTDRNFTSAAPAEVRRQTEHRHGMRHTIVPRCEKTSALARLAIQSETRCTQENYNMYVLNRARALIQGNVNHGIVASEWWG